MEDLVGLKLYLDTIGWSLIIAVVICHQVVDWWIYLVLFLIRRIHI